MSDTAKSSEEIEDVLSSIRRLVSDHHLPSRGPSDPAPGAASGSTDDRLVLTPALRVTDPDDPWAPVQRQDKSDAHPDDGDDWELDDRLSDFASVGDDEGHAVEDVHTLPASDPEGIAADLSAGETAASEPDFDMDDSAAEPAADAAFDTAEDAVAELLGDSAAKDIADFEPEVGDVDWPGTNADRALRDLAAARGATHSAAQGAPDDVAEHADQDQSDKLDFTPIFSRRRAEELAATTADQSSEEGAVEDAPDEQVTPDAEDMRAEDLASEADLQPGLAADQGRPHLRAISPETEETQDFGEAIEQDDVEDFGDELSPFTFPEGEAGILDEATLREIVAEVVREELQGPLGQRITRNVRKMVRREIRLMLAADDLD